MRSTFFVVGVRCIVGVVFGNDGGGIINIGGGVGVFCVMFWLFVPIVIAIDVIFSVLLSLLSSDCIVLICTCSIVCD